MKEILQDLEILILQNEDDFDRGKGKFILRNFIKEKQVEQLTLTDVSQQRELLVALIKWFRTDGLYYSKTEEEVVDEFLATNWCEGNN